MSKVVFFKSWTLFPQQSTVTILSFYNVFQYLIKTKDHAKMPICLLAKGSLFMYLYVYPWLNSILKCNRGSSDLLNNIYTWYY